MQTVASIYSELGIPLLNVHGETLAPVGKQDRGGNLGSVRIASHYQITVIEKLHYYNHITIRQ